MKKLFAIVMVAFIALCTPKILYAQVDPVGKNGVAIGGYDVVSYFTTNNAVKGNAQYKASYNGITYYFANAQNQQAFESNPNKYLPQYDGFCALAVSYGKKISVDPQTFKVKDDKLYLFFHGKTTRGSVNSLEAWNKDEARLLKKADGLWPDVKKKKYKPEDTL
jgi:YHS domain-containing protein